MSMTVFTENGTSNIELGIEGFKFADLFDAVRLKDLAECFYAEVESHDPVLHTALSKYMAAHGRGYEPKVESKILTDSAPYLSAFIARLFNIDREREDLARAVTVQNPVWGFKFFVQRRAIKKYKADQIAELDEAELYRAITELRNTAFDETLVRDEELSIAEMTCHLLNAEEVLLKDGEAVDETVRSTVDK